ncbi:MAG: ampC 2 [Gammaproteobacteria bacterium]|nr:ampC 2 [Gammaproteobacteria bacterium]
MNHKKLLAWCCSLLISSQAFADTSGQTPNPAPIVTQAINQLMQKDHIPGAAVELYVNGQAYSYYFGDRNTAHHLPVNSKTLFEIGSMSKVFTSILLAIEVKQNTLQLDDTLGELLPALHQTKGPIASVTLQDLATHTSGLPLNSPLPLHAKFNINTANTLHQYLLAWQPSAPVGSQWQYSNFGVGLLGISLEDKVGWPYNKLVEAYIFKPLHMEDSGTNLPSWHLNYAQGYSNGQAAEHMTWGMFPASGGIESSPRDMQHFLGAALDLPGVPSSLESAIKMTETPYVQTTGMQQGLGWEIYPFAPTDTSFTAQPSDKSFGPLPASQLSPEQSVYDGSLLLQSTGATNGFSSFIGLVPNAKTGVVILTNSYFNEGDLINTGRSILKQLMQP